MATNSTSRLLLAFVSAGVAALATVLATRPRGHQQPAAPAPLSRRDQLRGVVRTANPDAFKPTLSLQAGKE